MPKFKMTFEYFVSVMRSSVIIVFGMMLFNLFKKKWLLVLFDLLFIYSCVILFAVIQGTGDEKIWFEEYRLLLFFPASVSLAYHLIDLKTSRVLLPAMLLICGILSVKGILRNYSYFHENLNYADRLIERGRTEKEKKYIICSANVPELYVDNIWSLPFETLLLSSLENPDSAVTVFATKDVDKYDDLIKDPNYFLGPDWAVDMYDDPGCYIRKEYFNLPAKGYLKLNSPQKYSPEDSIYFNRKNVTIHPLRETYFCNEGSFTVAEVNIENRSNKKIPSMIRLYPATFLTYHLYNERGDSLLKWDNWRTALETDVDRVSRNGLNINTKKLYKGSYVVETDFVTESVTWLQINARFKLTIK
jgi:hypothetical protein